jgi:hypothetical protein
MVGTGFRKRSCSNKRLERDDDSKKSHHALAARPFQTIGLRGEVVTHAPEPSGHGGFAGDRAQSIALLGERAVALGELARFCRLPAPLPRSYLNRAIGPELARARYLPCPCARPTAVTWKTYDFSGVHEDNSIVARQHARSACYAGAKTFRSKNRRRHERRDVHTHRWYSDRPVIIRHNFVTNS